MFAMLRYTPSAYTAVRRHYKPHPDLHGLILQRHKLHPGMHSLHHAASNKFAAAPGMHYLCTTNRIYQPI